jgi:hypothetical protein
MTLSCYSGLRCATIAEALAPPARRNTTDGNQSIFTTPARTTGRTFTSSSLRAGTPATAAALARSFRFAQPCGYRSFSRGFLGRVAIRFVKFA